MASQIASLIIVYSTVDTGADQRKHQSTVSLAFVRGIHRWPVNSLHKGLVSCKMFPFDDVIMVQVNAEFCGQSQFKLTFPNQSYIVKSPFVKQFNWLKKWACKLLVKGNMKSDLSVQPLRESIPRLLNEGMTTMTTCCAPACSQGCQAPPVKPQGVWARGIYGERGHVTSETGVAEVAVFRALQHNEKHWHY